MRGVIQRNVNYNMANMLTIAATLALASHILQQTTACSTLRNSKIKLYNTTSTFNLEFPNDNDIYDYNLTVVYKWNVDNPGNEDFDGFLIHLHDVGETSGNNHNRRSAQRDPIGFPPPLGGFNDFSGLGGFEPPFSMFPGNIIWEPNYCKNMDNLIWIVNSKNESVQCQIPCTEHTEVPCNQSALCRQLDDTGFKAYPKDLFEFRSEISFGRKYEIEIFVYNNWNIDGNPHSYQFTSPFCLEETIETHKFNLTIAKEFCEMEQNISASFVSSGPVLDVHLDRLKPDLKDHTVTAYIKFKAPHDVATGMRLDLIYVNNHEQGEVNTTKIKIDGRDPISEYYTVPIYRLPFGIDSITITLLARVVELECTDTEENSCKETLGVEKNFEFSIPDIDGCHNPAESVWKDYQYCHSNATCTDFEQDSEVPAKCSCTTGFVGDGVSIIWGGDGCVDNNNCDNETCVDNAACTDLPPPSLGVTCKCKSGYFGDGYVTGSKCTSVKFVVALAVGLPIAFFVVLGLVFIVWRYKLTKKRTLELALSKFIVNSHKDPNYFSPTVIGNKLPQEGLIADIKWELEREKIMLGNVIGRGNFGVVYKAVLKTETSERTVAVKMTPPSPTGDVRTEFLAEISLIATLGKHENILGIVGCCTKTQQLCLVLEYMKYGDLLHFLWDAREANSEPIYDLTEREMCQVGWQVANAMSYLRKMKIIHGDIAARNILVGENLVCKISDFGLANDVYRYGLIKGATERKVPYKWISPERMMMGKVPITWKSDVWSFGILLYEMITLGGAPFSETPQDELFSKLQTGYRMTRPSSCSQHLYNIMSSCWDWSPSKRPSFEDLQRQLRNLPTLTDGTYVNLTLMVDVLDQHNYLEINQQRSERVIADIPTNESAGNIATNNNDDVIRNNFAV